MSSRVSFANNKKHFNVLRLDCYSHCQFLRKYRKIYMDFVEANVTWCQYCLVVVDRLTKYAHLVGLKHSSDAFKVAAVFIKEVVRLYVFPTSIISDLDRIFLSTFWRELFKLHGTTLKKSTSYHPKPTANRRLSKKA